jgi:hypothetical protein
MYKKLGKVWRCPFEDVIVQIIMFKAFGGFCKVPECKFHRGVLIDNTCSHKLNESLKCKIHQEIAYRKVK